MPAVLRTIAADITTLSVDAIVNAANSSLMGGGGVDGAIHRAAGPELKESCRDLKGCNPGDAKITPGFALPARHVIHTVGPVWRDGGHGEAVTLSSCYRRSLEVAADSRLTSVAFPCISTGVYRFPPELAARVAIQSVREALQVHPGIREVIFCCLTGEEKLQYDALLEAQVAE